MDWFWVKDIALILLSVLTYIGGRAQASASAKKTSIEGTILTADKIDELLNKLMLAKEEMIELKAQIAETTRDSKELKDLKSKILVICDEVERDVDKGIEMLKRLKERIE